MTADFDLQQAIIILKLGLKISDEADRIHNCGHFIMKRSEFFKNPDKMEVYLNAVLTELEEKRSELVNMITSNLTDEINEE